MASVMTEIAASLLIFICAVQGTRSLLIEQEESLNATLGQNISLCCIVLEDFERSITQLEWYKEGEIQKLVVFNPSFKPHYYADVKLQLVYRPNSKTVQGSILHLHNVTERQSGKYVCEITTFPDGSFKNYTKVQITEPWILAKIVSPGRSLIEGDEVKISCVSDPPADSFRLFSLQSNLSLISWSGQFTILNVTRHSKDLVCQPLWNSSSQHLQSLRATVQLTVDFLDNIWCHPRSPIQIEIGTNLTITCSAKSSKSLHYVWMKGNVTVSHNATLSLWSVTLGHSGTYSLIVNAGNNSLLMRQKHVVVTVLNRTHVEHQSSTITIAKMTQTTGGTTLTTAQPSFTATTSQPGPVSTTVYSTSTESDLYISTTTPSAGNITTSHANVTAAHVVERSPNATSLQNSTKESTLSAGCCQWQTVTSSLGSTREAFSHSHTNTRTATFTSKSTLTTLTILTAETFTVKSPKEHSSKTHVIYILIPILLLLVLIGFLYRRYRIQKRMDMPPPFKPPPPPVKYTSVRSQDKPETDILV